MLKVDASVYCADTTQAEMFTKRFAEFIETFFHEEPDGEETADIVGASWQIKIAGPEEILNIEDYEEKDDEEAVNSI